MDLEKIIKLLDSVKKLTYKQIGVLSVIGVLSSAGYFIWEKRNEIWEIAASKPEIRREASLPDGALMSLKTEAVYQVRQFLRSNPEVGLVAVSGLEFHLKTRNTIMVMAATKKLRDQVQRIAIPGEINPNGYPFSGPIFSDSNSVDTEQTIRVIRGEFTCADTKDVGIAKINPAFAELFVKTCRIPLPPVSVTLAGFMTIHLLENVSEERLQNIRHDLTVLSQTLISYADTPKRTLIFGYAYPDNTCATESNCFYEVFDRF